MSAAEQVRGNRERDGATPDSIRGQQLLLDFLSDHEAACPVCGYNLKALTRPVCPECRQDLVLTVGVARLRLGWLLMALVPGFFSGIAALFVFVPIVLRVVIGDGLISPALTAVDLFGWCSGIFAVMLAFRPRMRHRFLAQSPARQRWLAIIIWSVHIAALALLILLGPAYL